MSIEIGSSVVVVWFRNSAVTPHSGTEQSGGGEELLSRLSVRSDTIGRARYERRRVTDTILIILITRTTQMLQSLELTEAR